MMRNIRIFVVALGLATHYTPAIAADLPSTTQLENIPGDLSSRSTPFIAWHGDLTKIGYLESEYQMTGKASVYQLDVNERLIKDIVDAPYTTRFLVRRPVDSEDFNGTVYLEILNATAGWDGDPIWQGTHRYMTQTGAAYVGLTSKPVAINFLRDRWGDPEQFGKRNRERYAALSMPYFGQVWDILAQLSNLLRAKNSTANPLRDLTVQKLVLVGYSQSVDYEVTFANHFHEMAMIDGYYLGAGSGTVKRLNRLEGPEEYSIDDPHNLIRTRVPVVRFQTQTEVQEPRFNASRARQTEADFPLVRTYEMAGGAHVDVNTSTNGARSMARDLGLSSHGAACDLPINPLPIDFVQAAMLSILSHWIDGTPPPPSELLAFTDIESLALTFGPDGNAVGGIRLPQLAMPMGRYLGRNTGEGFCFLYGGFAPIDHDAFEQRYGTKSDYLEQLRQRIKPVVEARFLLEGDVERFIEHASSTIDSLE